MSHRGTTRTALVAVALSALLAPSAMAQTSTSSTATARIATTVINPCTKQYVSVAGSTALSVAETVDGNGQLTVGLDGVTKAIGAAFSSAGTRYPMSESDSVSVFSTGPESIDVTFVSKLAAKGATRSDNWRLFITIKASVDQFGHITAASAAPAGTACIG
jgi:hypothetical protein